MPESSTSEASPRSAVEPWWQQRRAALCAAADDGPAYVYDPTTIRHAVHALRSAFADVQWLFAVKANANPDVLSTIAREGVGFECVSLGELVTAKNVLKTCQATAPLMYAPNFVSRQEMAQACAAFPVGQAGIELEINVDNADTVLRDPAVFAARDVLLRIDLPEGDGHHHHVKTAGVATKFGMDLSDVNAAAAAIHNAGGRVVGLHAHAGSGIVDALHWSRVFSYLAGVAGTLPHVRVLDVGGGLAVPARATDAALDLRAAGEALTHARAAFPQYQVRMEPGRFLVAEAGVLVAKVAQLKRKGSQVFVGLETGMNALIRPALYGAYHEVVNLTRLGEPATEKYTVVGPICESADVFGVDRPLPKTAEGDVMAILTAGAYGRSMASSYNLREPPREVVL